MEAETLALAHEIDFSFLGLFARATLIVKIVMITLIAASTSDMRRDWVMPVFAFGMASFRPAGGEARARAISEQTRVFQLAESLGGVESLIELPGAMTHLTLQGSDLAVPADLVRLSVGIEHVDDLWADLVQAIDGLTD